MFQPTIVQYSGQPYAVEYVDDSYRLHITRVTARTWQPFKRPVTAIVEASDVSVMRGELSSGVPSVDLQPVESTDVPRIEVTNAAQDIVDTAAQVAERFAYELGDLVFGATAMFPADYTDQIYPLWSWKSDVRDSFREGPFCACESSYCDHGRRSCLRANAGLPMLYVGDVCQGCADANPSFMVDPFPADGVFAPDRPFGMGDRVVTREGNGTVVGGSAWYGDAGDRVIALDSGERLSFESYLLAPGIAPVVVPDTLTVIMTVDIVDHWGSGVLYHAGDLAELITAPTTGTDQWGHGFIVGGLTTDQVILFPDEYRVAMSKDHRDAYHGHMAVRAREQEQWTADAVDMAYRAWSNYGAGMNVPVFVWQGTPRPLKIEAEGRRWAAHRAIVDTSSWKV